MARRARRAFTLIELLVVLAIIAMILALATPAVMGILKTTTIIAATDILRSAVTTTRSTAISSRRSCSVDIRNSPDGKTTDYISTTSILTAEDFEPYDDDTGSFKVEDILELADKWGFFPEKDAWEIYPQLTRELWVGRMNVDAEPYAGNAYAWARKSWTSDEPAIDVESEILARFRSRRVTNPRLEWGFGLLSNFTKTDGECFGYRFAVRVATTRAGWNTSSRATIEKIHSPSNPSNENFYEAQGAGTVSGQVSARDLDFPGEQVTAVVTQGVWYWMKMNVKRVQKVVIIAGKVWAEGASEPPSWTVGPVYDLWDDAKPDPYLHISGRGNFGGSAAPIAGGCGGVWSSGAEVASDDFSVDRRSTWLLPKGIHMQPKRYDPDAPADVRDDLDLVALERYEAGSFPLSYRPDGTAASDVPLVLVITNIAGENRRVVQVDRNTGRVEAADLVDISE